MLSDLQLIQTATASCFLVRAVAMDSGNQRISVPHGPMLLVSLTQVRKFGGDALDLPQIKTMVGTYIPDPTDTTGYNSDKIGGFPCVWPFSLFLMKAIGIAWVTFDSTSGKSGSATPRIFVGVASQGSDNVFVTNDGGSTCKFVDSIFGLLFVDVSIGRDRCCWAKYHLHPS